jgi:dihydrodipicolinate synthase/N-acetylneuraminate lyase
MDRDSVDWKGYIPAITTPFAADGELDRDDFRQLLDWMVAERMHGVALAGTTGEWFSLEPAERKELFALGAEQIEGRITVLGGCTSYTPHESIEYARAARDAGLDGIFLTPPPYVVPSEREIVAFYEAVSDAVDIAICVYNWPRGTGVDMRPSLLQRLAEIESVVAVKNSTGDVGLFLEGFFAVKDEVRYFGVPMTELGITLLQHHGADGTIGAGAVLGSDHPLFFEHVWAGDLDAARRCGARDRLLFEHWINADYSPRFGSPQAIMKAALNLRGLPGGQPRPPLLPLTDEESERVAATLAELGLLAVPV